MAAAFEGREPDAQDHPHLRAVRRIPGPVPGDQGDADPRLPEAPGPVLELRALLAACSGKTFEDRRDTALLLLLMDTGACVGEAVGIAEDDVDLDQGEVSVRGKGQRTRVLPLGAKAIKTLDRFLRVRSRHPRASAPWLFI
jgi:site-specific recombinase XerD